MTNGGEFINYSQSKSISEERDLQLDSVGMYFFSGKIALKINPMSKNTAPIKISPNKNPIKKSILQI